MSFGTYVRRAGVNVNKTTVLSSSTVEQSKPLYPECLPLKTKFETLEQLPTQIHGVTCHIPRICGDTAQNIKCRRRYLGHCCTLYDSLSCGRDPAIRDTTCCLSSVQYFQTAERLKVCHPLTLFRFAFVFVLLTIFMPHDQPSRQFATAHLVSLSSSLAYINVLLILFLWSAIPSLDFLKRTDRRRRNRTQTGYNRWIMRSYWILNWKAFYQPTGHRPLVTCQRNQMARRHFRWQH
jgi:hypothetical protein